MRVPKRALQPGEVVLLAVRHHGHVAIWPAVAAMVLAAIGGGVHGALARQHLGWIVLATAGVWVTLCAPRLLRWRTTGMIITTRRLIVRRGWFGSASTDVVWPDVDDVWTDQGWWQRNMGWGTVHIDLHAPEDHHPDPDHDPDHRDVVSLALVSVAAPDDFRSRCVVAMEIADLVREGGDRNDLMALIDDLGDRGHLTDHDQQQLRAMAAAIIAA